MDVNVYSLSLYFSELLTQDSDLLKATLSLSHATRVAVTTGFPCHAHLEVKEETDGLPGALAVCHALLLLDKQVILVADAGNAALFQSCVDHMVSIGGLKSSIPVLSFGEAKELWYKASDSSRPPFDCFLAIERVGKNRKGTYLAMKGTNISPYVDPVDTLFEEAQKSPLVTAIAIGDGGNELGMGKVYEAIKRHIPLGEEIGCVVGGDRVIASGVSNWAGHALAAALCVVSSCPLHWRYRNRGVNTETPPIWDIDDFMQVDQVRCPHTTDSHTHTHTHTHTHRGK